MYCGFYDNGRLSKYLSEKSCQAISSCGAAAMRYASKTLAYVRVSVLFFQGTYAREQRA